MKKWVENQAAAYVISLSGIYVEVPHYMIGRREMNADNPRFV